MSQLKIKDLYPIFVDGKLPDYPIELFADGQPATLTWKWEFVRHTDEDSDEPPEGTNHLRIDVKTEWLPFDPENVPEAKEGLCLLVKRQTGNTVYSVYSFNVIDGNWQDIEGDVLWEYHNLDKAAYKLIKI
jgi:hypothetical protein